MAEIIEFRPAPRRSKTEVEGTAEVVKLGPWGVYEFPWGVGIRHRKGPWETVILRGGQEIDVTGIPVELHLNGIQFLGVFEQRREPR